MDNRKIVIVGYLITAAIAGVLSKASFQALHSLSSTVRRMPYSRVALDYLPIAIAAIVFVALFFNKRAGDFFDEVVSELKKVSWPAREDVVKSTVVVLGCVLFASCVLAIFDVTFGMVIDFILPKTTKGNV